MRLAASFAVASAFALSACSAIHSAALRGQTSNVEAELDKGADINGRFGAAGYTPLMAAASSGNAETVKLLLKRGADPTLKASNGKTVLDWAFIQFAADPTPQQRAEVLAVLHAALHIPDPNAAPAPAEPKEEKPASASPAPWWASGASQPQAAANPSQPEK